MTQIKNTDLLQDGIFSDFQDDAKKTVNVLKTLEKALADVAIASAKIAEETPASGYKNIQAKAKAVDDYTEAERGLKEVQAEIIKLEKLREEQDKRAESQRKANASKELARLAKEEATRAKALAKEAERQAKKKKTVKEMSDAEIKADVIQKKHDSDRAKRLKTEAILLDEQAGAIEKLLARNTQLRTQRDSMPDIVSPESVTAIKAINAEIDANNTTISENSDKLKQQKMNVGNYTDSILEALGASKGFGGGVAGVTSAFDGLNPILAGATKGYQRYTSWAEKARSKTEATGESVSRTRKAFVGLSVSAGALAGGALTLLASAFAKSRAGGEQLAVVQQKISTSAGVIANKMLDATGQTANFGNEADKATYKLKELQAETEDLQKLVSNDPRVKQSKVVTKALEENKKAISDLKNELIELEKKGITPVQGSAQTLVEIWNDDSINNYIKLVSDLRVQTGAYSIELARLNGLAEANDAIEGNNTLSLNDRIAAMKEAIKYTEQAAKKQEDLNRTALELANLDLYFNDRVNLAGLFEKWGVTAENAGTKITELYETNQQFAKDLDSSANIDKLNAVQNAMAGIVTAQFQLISKQTQNQAKLDMAVQDQAEMDLDMLQDTYGKKLALIEQDIANTRISTAQKKKLGEDALANLEKTSKRTREVLTQEGLAGSQDQEAILNLFDIQDLDNLNMAIRSLEKSEMIEKRVQQYIEDYKEYLVQVRDLKQDIADEDARIATLNADRASYQKQIDQIKALKDIKGLTSEQYNEELEKIEKQASDEALQAEYDATTESLKLLTDESEERAILLTRQKELELQIEKEKTAGIKDELAKQEEARAEDIKKTGEMMQTGVALLDAFYKAQGDARLSAIDKNISSSEKRQNELIALADKQSESATENLAFEQKKQAELQAQRAQEIKRQKALEIGLVALKVYASKVASGDKNALASTAVDVSLLTAFVSSIPTALKGTNDQTVAEVYGAPDMAGRDGYIMRVDGAETILSPEKTKEYHNSLKENAQSGNVVTMESPAMIRRLDNIERAITNQPVYLGRDYDPTARAVIETVAYKNRLVHTHKKTGIFGN